MKHIEILFWKIAKHIIKKGYGADCSAPDIPRPILPRCASCEAKEVIDFIDRHIDLIK
ncbi:MAG: hypothetical protein PHC75_10875 [Burkholderiales bacterium]|nr:hypothetical protein [Burkholderiales bacterium]